MNAAVPEDDRDDGERRCPRGPGASRAAGRSAPMTTTCTTSTTRTPSTLPASSPPRPSGVVDSSRRTPLRRSNDEAIACDVNDVVITASARMPGVRKSIRLAPPVSRSIPVDLRQPDEDQHGHDDRDEQLLAVAQDGARLERGLREDALAGAGRGGAHRRFRPVRSRKTSSRVRRPTVSRVASAPCAASQAVTRGDRVGVDGAGDGVGAVARLGDDEARAERGVQVEPGRGLEPQGPVLGRGDERRHGALRR